MNHKPSAHGRTQFIERRTDVMGKMSLSYCEEALHEARIDSGYCLDAHDLIPTGAFGHLEGEIVADRDHGLAMFY